MALVIKDQRTLHLGALNHASSTHVVPVAIAGLDESVPAVGTLVGLFLAMSLLVIDHVAELGRLDMTLEAPEELVCPASRLIHHVVFLESHVAGVWPVPVADSFLDHLLENWNPLGIVRDAISRCRVFAKFYHNVRSDSCCDKIIINLLDNNLVGVLFRLHHRVTKALI